MSWTVDNARGTALGVVDEPQLDVSDGVLAPGDALIFYTDGVIERPDADIDSGITWLLGEVGAVIAEWPVIAVPARIMEQVSRGDDDRAVLVLARE